MNALLVLNCGSSSIKFQTFLVDETPGTGAPLGTVDVSGLLERIGSEGALLKLTVAGRPLPVETGSALDHTEALDWLLTVLGRPTGAGPNPTLVAVGHRVVHGGEHFPRSVLIDDAVLERIRSCVDLAPLHNPHNLRGINAVSLRLPGVPQVAVFDTAFHQTMPPVAFRYALPHVLYARHGLRRYGFHGSSHRWVSRRAMDRMSPADPASWRLVTAHLGNGCSIAALKGGRTMDTSMGFTPLEGLVMGTRCGDLDPQVVLHLMEREDLDRAQVSALLNKHSGLLGLSGTSPDMRDLLEASSTGHEGSRLAVDVFCYRLRKYIGAYAAALGGLDALVFTGGIGVHSAPVRAQTLKDLEFLGIDLDPAVNGGATDGRTETRITTTSSRVQVWVIPTDEERVIAEDTLALVQTGDQGLG